MNDKVYGVYIYDYEGSYLQTPLYKDLPKAISNARLEVWKLQKRVVEMQKFTKKENLNDTSDYRDFEKVSDKEWKGGYNNWSGVRIDEIEII